MHDYHPTIITAPDYERLRDLMCTMIGARTPFANLLRQKLGSAMVVLPTEITPDIVTSGRRVRFTIDGEKTGERTLCWDAPVRGDSGSLWLCAPRGLALLGLSVGHSISYTTTMRRREFAEIDYVFPKDNDAIPQFEPFGEPAAVLDSASVREAREPAGAPIAI